MLCLESNLLSSSFTFFRRIGPLLAVLPGLKPTLLNYFHATEESHVSHCRYSLVLLTSSDLHLPSVISRDGSFGHLLQNTEEGDQKEQQLVSVNAYKHSQCGELELFHYVLTTTCSVG